MKKKNHLIHVLIMLLLASCTPELINSPGNSDFKIADAKNFFEEHATDLQNVNFDQKSASRGSERGNITPDWKLAKITRSDKITTVEIPLDGDVCKVAQVFKMNRLKKMNGFSTGVTTKLVVQKHSKCEMARQFVVTMIDDWSPNFQKEKTRDYYSKNHFSGYIIISAVTGEYLESFQSINGRWKRVYIAKGTKEDLEDQQNVNLRLLGADASTATYNFGEGGTLTCPNCGNASSMCTCCKYCNGQGCNVCTITVYPTCQKCGYTGPGATTGSCYCCSWCHNYPCTCTINYCPYCSSNPCVCASYACQYCGNRYCYGSCQGGGGGTEPNPDECQHVRCPICNKMIRMQSGRSTGSICDSHEYCENDGKCVDVQLSVSQNLITLGDSYTITLVLTPANTVCNDITYYIIKEGQEFTLLKEGIPTYLTTMARSPGNYQIKAEIMQDETNITYPSNSVGVTHVFPNRNEILQQQVVIDGMNHSWTQTLAAADATGIQEFGGVVLLNTRVDNTGNLYRYESAQGIKTPYSADVVSVILTWDECDYGPAQGGEFAVLLFHTHPPYWEYGGNDKYYRRVGPSKLDSSNHTTMPAVVKDFQHAPDSIIRTQMTRSAYEGTEKLYHYGINRRNN